MHLFTRLIISLLFITITGHFHPVLSKTTDTPSEDSAYHSTQEIIKIAASPPGGAYSIVGELLAGKLSDEERRFISVDNGKGSLDNLKALLSGDAHFAIVQADVLFSFSSGPYRLTHLSAPEQHRQFQVSLSDLYPVAVTPLYTEVLHFLIRHPLNPESVQELSALKFYLGKEGSGTRFTVETVFECLGLPLEENIVDSGSCCAYKYFVGDRYLDSCKAAVCPEELPPPDVIPVMGVPGFPYIRRFLAIPPDSSMRLEETIARDFVHSSTCLAFLFSLKPGSLSRITSTFPTLRPYRIFVEKFFTTKDGNPNICVSSGDDIDTVGVRALLITHSREGPSLVRKVLKTLYPNGKNDLGWIVKDAPSDMFRPDEGGDASPEILKALLQDSFSETTLSTFFSGLETIPFHPEARSFIRDISSWRKMDLASWFYKTIIILLAMSIVLFTIFKREWIEYKWHRNRGIILLLVDFLALLFFAVFTYSVESKANSNFSNLRESVWSILTWLLSGFEDRPPLTSWGQAGSVLFLATWTALILLLINYILKERMQSLIEEDRVPHKIKNHHVICGWNERAIGIIRQLRGELLSKWEKIQNVVVIADADKIGETKLIRQKYGPCFRDVIFLRDDPADREALAYAQIERAASVTILADDDLEDNSDGKTALILSGIKAHIESCETNKKSKTGTLRGMPSKLYGRWMPSKKAVNTNLAIVIELVNPHNKKHILAIDRECETINITTTDSHSLAQVARAPGLVQFFFDILSITLETNELYPETLPLQLRNFTFSQVSTLLLRLRKELSRRSINAFALHEMIFRPTTLPTFNRRKNKLEQGTGKTESMNENMRHSPNQWCHLGWFRFLPEWRLRFVPIGLKMKDHTCTCIWPPWRGKKGEACQPIPDDGIPPWNQCDLLVMAPDKPDIEWLFRQRKIKRIIKELIKEEDDGTEK